MVKPGYKETDAGIIPEDWDARLVGENLDFKNGLNKAKAYFGHGTPIINYMDVFGNSGLQASDVAGLVSVTSEEQSAYSARKGDLFFTRTSETVDEIGMSAVLLENLDSAVFSGFVLRGRDKTSASALDIDFKKYCFRSSVVRKQIRSTASYTTRALTNGKLLSKVFVPTPSDTDEQKAIAEALSDVDGLIVGLEALIAKKRDLKTATMQQLLTGKTRLPGFGGGVGMKQTELGEIPEDWSIAGLRGLLQANPRYGINAAAAPATGSGPTYIRITDISEDGAFSPNPAVEVIHKAALEYLLEEGDLVFARTGASVGKSYEYKRSDGELVFAGFLIKISPDPKKLLPSYLFQFSKTKRYWDWVQLTSMRSGQPGINGQEYASMPIPLPEKDEQEKICEVLGDFDANILALQQDLKKAKALKQGMMQELLTGRTRLI
ncbi:MAG: restriction endonuclease subunit S [Tateyamaria sp.]|uniref:restriction endonuclease subunit S n=1 Tax=Tateyamaria sp. TaxID=1929288 RepID=UPI0032A0D442